MDRNSQNIRSVIVDRLGAIAMMYVPIDHRNTLNAMSRLRRFYRDGNIGKQAEAHRFIGKAVMASRPAQGVAVWRFIFYYSIQRIDRKASRQSRDFKATF